MNKTAIIVVSHNGRDITDPLCNNITSFTKSPHDLYVIETGSKLDKLSTYATFWVKDGIRMTRGFNWGIKYALWKEKMEGTFHYDSFWLLVNDAHLYEVDSLTPMVNFMRSNPDCGQIHPYITNSPSRVLKKMGSGCRKVSYVEIICPLLSRAAIEIPNFLDEKLFYGWGLDYDMPYMLHKQGLRTYLCDDVGVVHSAGTTVCTGNDDQLKTMQQQFNVSRENMVQVMLEKYGPQWGHHFLQSVPSDVPKDSLLIWLRDIGQNL